MTTPPPANPSRPPHLADHRRSGWPWALLFAGLVGTAFLARSQKAEADRLAAQEFNSACSDIVIKLEDHLLVHEQILRSAAAFFSGSDEITRAEWRSFIERQKLSETHPGMEGLGFVLVVPRPKLEPHLRAVRAEGYPAYRIWPEGERATYSTILFLEPFTERNLRSFGYDMLTEPVRRAAMERARDQDGAALSGKVLLVQETAADVHASTLLYVPVYRQGAAITSVAERRAALVGWVYSPFRMTHLLQEMLKGWQETDRPKIRLAIVDRETTPPGTETLLYDSQDGGDRPITPPRGGGATRQTEIGVAGRHWLLRFSQTGCTADYSETWLVLVGGALTSLLFSGLALSLANTRFTARQIAGRLTADLRASEERWKFAVEGTGDGVWDWNVATHAVTYSKRWKGMLGYDEAEIGSTFEEWSQRVHPDDFPPMMAALQAHLDGRAPTYRQEYRTRCKDGRWKWILDRGLVVSRDAAGKPLRVTGTNQDITERKQAEAALRESNTQLQAEIAKRTGAEAALRESQAFYHALVSQLPAGVFRKDAAGRYVFVSPWFCQLKHMQEESFLGKTAMEVAGTPAAQADPSGQAVKYAAHGEDHHSQIMATGQSIELVEEYAASDGRKMFINVLKSPVRGPDGSLVGTQGLLFDITERKLTEAALQASEEKFSKVFHDAPVWIAITAMPEGTYVDVNDEALRASGFSRQEVIGHTAAELGWLQAEGRAQLVRLIREYGRIDGLEMTFGTKDRRTLHGWVNGEQILLGGRPCLLTVTVDITARKQAEEKLRRSEESLAITLQSIGDAVIATDATGVITRINPAAERLTGWSVAEALGRPLSEVFHIVNAATRARALDPVELVMARGEVVGLANHTSLLARDGREFQIADSAAPIRDAAGQITGVVLVFSDVTEKYRVQQALESTAELLERTGEIARIGGWELDLRTMQPLWSQETFFIHEIDPPVAPALDQGLAFYAPEARPVIQAAVQAAIDHGTPYDVEVPLFTAKGRPIWVRAQCTPVKENGRVIKLRGAFQDITERKFAEKALRESLEEKESLLKEVHHRVKNNLQVITSLLRLESGRATQPGTKSVLGDMQGRIRSMALLHESLYRSGTFAAVDLGGYLKQIATQCFRTLVAAPGDIQLQLDVAAAIVEMDQAMPCGLLVNELVSNSLKHGFPAGRTGEVRVELHLVDGGPSLCLRVSDTGVGLPPDFEEKRGHSLGLQLASDLARQIGGRLEIGPGATFTIIFVPQRNAPISPLPT